MIKRVSIFSLLLATYTIIPNQIPATIPSIVDPHTQSEALEQSEQNIALMEKLCTAITKNCDPGAVNANEKNITNAISDYLENCLENTKNSNNIESVEHEALELLDYLKVRVKEDEAYAIASMLFMINWSKRVNEIAVDIEDPFQQADNLRNAITKISAMVERIFLEPMGEIINKN